MLKFLVLTLIIAMLLPALPSMAESLWPAEQSKSIYADKKAFKVGDLVTVIIVESAVSSSSASTNAKKDSELEAGPGVGPLLEKIPLFKYSGGDEIKASGATTRSSKFVAKMTARVVGIDAAGNLEIEGTKSVQTNKENEEIKLTGIIRPQDIAPDNTVPSTCIANAKITHAGSGPVGSRQKEGLISKIFKILF